MSTPQTLFIYESLTAGAYRQAHQNSSLLAEGRMMAEAVIADFAALDAFQVVTVWGSRLRRPRQPRLKTYVAESCQEEQSYFRQCCEQADRILIVTPESQDTLRNALRAARTINPEGVTNVSGEALDIGCDKWKLSQFCEDQGIAHPQTELWTGQAHHQPPVLLKPRDGAGCEGIRIVHEPPIPDDIDTDGRMIIQPLLPGVALSSAACFSSAGKRMLTLPLGEQQLKFTDSVEYEGGRIPWEDPMRDAAESQAERIWEILGRELTGLRGYVGIDWLWDNEPQTLRLVELNPRLTTSYIGYRKLFGRQIAEAMLERPLSPDASHIRNVQFAANPETVLPLPGEERT
ncbi:MAG: ATP-grasp domain-containing protein [Planctomycetaceae bacterium]|nr:ATP-grasp domain-containing protein [Planctomycetaceae bacterium]